MARPKNTPATTAPTKIPETKAVTNWTDELAGLARDEAAVEPTATGAFISTKGGAFTVDGVEVPGNTLDVVILDWMFENHFYSTKFDPDNPASPDCYAFGRVEKEMAPHEEAEHPQCDKCEGCPANEWGTADIGKGKACKNIRRLATISVTDFLEGPAAIAKAQVRMVKLTPTSLKAWAGYVQSLRDELKRPTWTVVTQLMLEPIPGKSGHCFKFAVVDQDDQGKDLLAAFTPEVLAALKKRRETTDEVLCVPYVKTADLPQKSTPAKGAKGQKFVPKGVPAKQAKFVPKGR